MCRRGFSIDRSINVIGRIRRYIRCWASNLYTRGCDRSRDGLVVIVMPIRIRMKSLCGVVDTLSPQIESPVDKTTLLVIDFGVLDDNGPIADSGFAPENVRIVTERR